MKKSMVGWKCISEIEILPFFWKNEFASFSGVRFQRINFISNPYLFQPENWPQIPSQLDNFDS